jgi:hypothetical protein
MKPFNIKTIIFTSTGLVTLSITAAFANPQDGNVVSGNVAIQQESATKLGITQTSDKAIVDWKSFSIGANEQTQIYMPSPIRLFSIAWSARIPLLFSAG